MTAKEYLEQIRRLDMRINADQAEMECYRMTVSSVGSPEFGQRYDPNTPTEAPYVRGVERLLEMNRAIEERIDLFVDLKDQAAKAIREIGDWKEQMVLIFRYLRYMTWRDIGDRMGVDEKTARRWHGKALEDFVLPGNYIRI